MFLVEHLDQQHQRDVSKQQQSEIGEKLKENITSVDLVVCLSFFCLFANLDVIIVRSQQFENSIYTPREWEAGFDEKKLLREVIDHPRLHFATLSHANYVCVCVFASLFSSSLSVCLVTCKRETWIIYSCCRVLVNLSSHIYTHLRAAAIILLRCIRSVTWLSSTSQHAMAREENTATRSETTKRTKKLDWILCTALPRRAEVQQCSENWNIEPMRLHSHQTTIAVAELRRKVN